VAAVRKYQRGAWQCYGSIVCHTGIIFALSSANRKLIRVLYLILRSASRGRERRDSAARGNTQTSMLKLARRRLLYVAKSKIISNSIKLIAAARVSGRRVLSSWRRRVRRLVVRKSSTGAAW
jgi:hypothetical protein